MSVTSNVDGKWPIDVLHDVIPNIISSMQSNTNTLCVARSHTIAIDDAGNHAENLSGICLY